MTKRRCKVIFLDVDGVIATDRAHDAALLAWWGTDSLNEAKRLQLQARRDKTYYPDYNRDNWPFDPEALAILHQIQRNHPEVLFVVSSTWREGETVETLTSKFQLKGLHVPIHSFTPRGKGWHPVRGPEILAWLSSPEIRMSDLEVTHYCAIDDMVEGLAEYIPGHHVRTGLETGLDDQAYQEVRKILEL